jgi:hypothetical protein
MCMGGLNSVYGRAQQCLWAGSTACMGGLNSVYGRAQQRVSAGSTMVQPISDHRYSSTHADDRSRIPAIIVLALRTWNHQIAAQGSAQRDASPRCAT